VQVGEHEFDGGHLELRVLVNGDAAAVVFDGAGAIDVESDFDPVAETGEMFVYRIVEDLINAMMEAALVGVTDVHAGAFPHGFEALKLIDLGGIVQVRVFCFDQRIHPKILARRQALSSVFGLEMSELSIWTAMSYITDRAHLEDPCDDGVGRANGVYG